VRANRMIGGLRASVPALLTVLLAIAMAGCGGGDDKSLQAPTNAQSAPAAAPTQPQAATTPGGCKQVQAPQPRNAPKEKKPAPLDSSKAWSLTFKTNCGDFTVALDLDTAPKASASLVSLARAGYFDNTLFHRIAPGFVIQGGDPTASGNGGPGYTTVDKPPRNARYTHGVVAMAKTPQEPAGAGGSQFFVVTGADVGLPPDYALVGKVTKGLDVVDRIGKLGDQSEQPTEPVVILTVTPSSG
jgi:cyclophilin family peptidyl-prolyl cis-trans isomerase